MTKFNTLLNSLVLLGVVLLISGCLNTTPITGGLYTNVKHGTNVGDGSAGAMKEGTACASSILGLVATGDASIDTARKNGGITKIAYVDHQSKSFYIFYAEYCTIVRGE